MNRRTFIKATGATALLTTVPAFSAPEQQWISMEDRKPEIGQKIIVLSKGFDFITGKGIYVKRCHIFVGERVTTEDVVYTLNSKPPNFAMEQRFRVMVDYSSTNILFCYTKADPIYPLEDIRKLKWGGIGEERMIHKFEHNISMMWVLKNVHWIPVDGQLPTYLPSLPKYKKSEPARPWYRFSSQQPKQDDYVEIKDREGDTDVGWIKKGVKTSKDGKPGDLIGNFIWLEKDYDKSVCRLSKINEKLWSWRYA